MQGKRRNKCMAFLLTLCLLLGLVPVDAKAADTTYDLWVGGVQVSEANKDDVLGDSTVYYDADSNTLTLNGANITGVRTDTKYYNDRYGIYSGLMDLNLVLEGTNTVDAMDGASSYGDDDVYGIRAKNLTVSGTGSLTAIGGDYGISVYILVVNNGTLVGTTADGYGIDAYGMTVNGGSVTGEGGGLGIGVYDTTLTVNGGTVIGKGKAASESGPVGCGLGTYKLVVTGGTVKGECAGHRGISVNILNAAGGKVTGTATTDYGDGIYVFDDVTVSGDAATVTGNGGKNGIYLDENNSALTATAGTVTGEGKKCGIKVPGTLKVSGTAEVTGTIDATGGIVIGDPDAMYDLYAGVDANTITMEGGKLTGNGDKYGICAKNAMTVTGGTVTAKASSLQSAISVKPDLTGYTNVGVKAGMFENNATEVTDLNTEYHKSGYVSIGPKQTTTYDLWVGGVQVTSDNKNDVLGDADNGETVTFDPTNNTLTLNGANITKGGESGGIESKLEQLNLKLENGNTVAPTDTGKELDGIYVAGSLTIDGDGTLTVQSPQDGRYGIKVSDGSLTVNGGKVEATSNNANGINIENGDITVNGGTVTGVCKPETGGGHGIKAKTLTVNDGEVTGTYEGYFSGSGIYVEKLDVKKGKVTATGSGNGIFALAITVEGGEVTATGSSVGVATGTMTVTGGKVTSEGKSCGIYATGLEVSGTAEVTGTVKRDSGTSDIDYPGIEADTITVKGGKLTGTVQNTGNVAIGGETGGLLLGIEAKTITVEGGELIADGKNYGISVQDKMTVSGGTVIAKAANTQGAISVKPDLSNYTNVSVKAGTFEGNATEVTDLTTNYHQSGYVSIGPKQATTYDLWVGGVQVTDTNKGDVLGDADNGATVKYDSTDNTLTLNGAKITEVYVVEDAGVPPVSYGIYSELTDLNLVLEGTSTVDAKTAANGKSEYAIGIDANNLTVSGTGSLTFKGSDYGISVSTLKVTGGTVTGEATKADYDSGGISADTITVTGGAVNGNKSEGYGGYGIEATTLTVTGGAVTGTNAKDCSIHAKNITVSNDGKLTGNGDGVGISAKILTINGGEVTGVSTGDMQGIYVSGDNAGNGGIMTVNSGTVKGSAVESIGIIVDGNYDKGTLTVKGGTVIGEATYSGISARYMTVEDGTVTGTSTESSGIRADVSFEVNGGTVSGISTNGIGIDANDKLQVAKGSKVIAKGKSTAIKVTGYWENDDHETEGAAITAAKTMIELPEGYLAPEHQIFGSAYKNENVYVSVATIADKNAAPTYNVDEHDFTGALAEITLPEQETTTQPEETETTPVKTNPVVKAQSVSIKVISKKLAAGRKVQMTPVVAPANTANKTVTWSSSNTKYATVDAAGKVSFKKAGAGKTVTITATAADGSGRAGSVKIKIMKHAVKSVKLKAAKTVKAGKKVKVKATVKTTGKKVNKKLQWTSSDTNYATVSSKGVVKTKKAGKGKTVKITAASTDGTNKKKTVKIKIK